MTGPLDRAIDLVRALPRDKQEIAAELLADFALNQRDGIYVLSDAEERLIDEGLAELDRGDVVSHDDIKELLGKYRR